MLFETGWWPTDPELQLLRKVNFVGLAAALDAIATGAHERVDLADYEAIPHNDRNVFDVLIQGGRIVLPGADPYRADIGIDFSRSLDLSEGTVADVGDLADYSGRDILIAEGMFIHPHQELLGEGPESGAYLEIGRPASMTVRVGADAESSPIWEIEQGVARRVDEP